MPIKLEDIAKATGFSIPTVSRVLTHSSYPVNESTRKKILEAAQTLGYQPNLSARSLRSNRTNTIGIIVDDIMSPFVPPIVRGIQDCLKENDFLSVIVNSDWDPNQEQSAINTLVSRPVDGLIFVEYSHRVRSEVLEKSNKPHMFVHRIFGSAINNSIVPDDYYGASLAVQHLIALGHRRIAYINGPEDWHNSRARYIGYKHELESHHIAFDPKLVQPGDWELESGYKAAQNFLSLDDPPTAVFAANDLMALGAIYAIQDAGLDVPGNIAVVGYDNRDFTKIVRPKITTVVMPVYEMGRIATESLLEQIAEGREEIEEIKVQGYLIIRDTCGADEIYKDNGGLNPKIAYRRVLLNKRPEEPFE
jgi:DNA-binding LacI/PurR family transcriptional regulator